MARSKPTDTPAPSGKAGRGPAAGGRGRTSGATATSGGKRGGKAKEPREGRIKRFGGQLRLIKQAYSLTRQNDPRLPWYLLGAFLGVVVVLEVIALLFG